MAKYFIGVPISNNNLDTVKEVSQTIDAAVSINDPVFFDSVSATWKQSTALTRPPQGVFQGSGVVINFGSLITTGLTPGRFYFLDSLNGGITTSTSSTIIGYSISATELLVDIDNKNIVNPFISGFLAGGSTGGLNTGVIDKIIFATQNSSRLPNDLLVGLGIPNSASSKVAGYVSGGNTGNVGNQFNADLVNVHKTLFSTEISSMVTALPGNRSGGSNNVDGEVGGYFIGGNTGGFSITDTIVKLVFANDTNSVILETAVVTGQGSAGLDDGINHGYIASRYNFAISVLITALNFTTDATRLALNNMVSATRTSNGVSSPTAGYTLDDSMNPGAVINQKLQFVSESVSMSTSMIGTSSTSVSVSSTSDGYLPISGSSQLFSFALETRSALALTLTAIGGGHGAFRSQ